MDPEEWIALLIEWLFYPYLWWRNHNRSSTLGGSREDNEAQGCWLKFGICAAIVVVTLALLLHYGIIHPPPL